MRWNRDEVTLALQVSITLVLLGSGIPIIVWSGDPELQKLASGWVGLAAGYWLR